MEFLQKLKISGGVNLSNLRSSRDTERTTSNSSTTSSRNEAKEDVSMPPRGSPAAKKMKNSSWPRYSKEGNCIQEFMMSESNRSLQRRKIPELDKKRAQFADLNLASYSDSGTMVDIQVYREGTVCSQSVRGIGPREDYRNILLGLQFGNVPSVNSLTSIYNFAEKPWVFAQLIQLQKRLGKDKFPLVEQAYYPNYKEMVSVEETAYYWYVKWFYV
ncbi:hypothetical protein OS493_011602 [Desmophyllum pertusum]|uniref:Uncharacterized protein n=1 Tax=Desmophyllum pertusum TaxID=174260 RepID=A0A9W9YQQ6_9CNID|nr:hypothetical protein OS493_011602 [Desmophyllum pertusum]